MYLGGWKINRDKDKENRWKEERYPEKEGKLDGMGGYGGYYLNGRAQSKEEVMGENSV